jgi:hypothetical protein
MHTCPCLFLCLAYFARSAHPVLQLRLIDFGRSRKLHDNEGGERRRQRQAEALENLARTVCDAGRLQAYLDSHLTLNSGEDGTRNNGVG